MTRSATPAGIEQTLEVLGTTHELSQDRGIGGAKFRAHSRMAAPPRVSTGGAALTCRLRHKLTSGRRERSLSSRSQTR